MKKFFTAMMVAVVALSIGISNAEAKRVGGGGSISKQSQSVSRQAAPAQNQAANTAKPAAPQSVPPKPAIPWKGILGGALLGLGMGALFSHLGMGGAMASMLSTVLMVALLGFAAMFIYRMLRRKSDQNGLQPAYAGAGYIPDVGSRLEPVQPAALQSVPLASGTDAVSNTPWGIPANFDAPGFLRHAKTHFIRLQAAWDKADINDIREFTTPEMYAELKMEIQERGASVNNTDVVSLDAELLGMEAAGNDHLASVKFTGMIKESDNAPTAPFSEVWNLTKPMSGQGGWVLAGIQQLP